MSEPEKAPRKRTFFGEEMYPELDWSTDREGRRRDMRSVRRQRKAIVILSIPLGSPGFLVGAHKGGAKPRNPSTSLSIGMARTYAEIHLCRRWIASCSRRPTTTTPGGYPQRTPKRLPLFLSLVVAGSDCDNKWKKAGELPEFKAAEVRLTQQAVRALGEAIGYTIGCVLLGLSLVGLYLWWKFTSVRLMVLHLSGQRIEPAGRPLGAPSGEVQGSEKPTG